MFKLRSVGFPPDAYSPLMPNQMLQEDLLRHTAKDLQTSNQEAWQQETSSTRPSHHRFKGAALQHKS